MHFLQLLRVSSFVLYFLYQTSIKRFGKHLTREILQFVYTEAYVQQLLF